MCWLKFVHLVWISRLKIFSLQPHLLRRWRYPAYFVSSLLEIVYLFVLSWLHLPYCTPYTYFVNLSSSFKNIASTWLWLSHTHEWQPCVCGVEPKHTTRHMLFSYKLWHTHTHKFKVSGKSICFSNTHPILFNANNKIHISQTNRICVANLYEGDRWKG